MITQELIRRMSTMRSVTDGHSIRLLQLDNSSNTPYPIPLALNVVPHLDWEIISTGFKIAGSAGAALLAWRQRRYRTVYGAYWETLHTRTGRRIRGNTAILLRPKVPLPLVPIGLRLDGINFTKERLEREFHDLGIHVKSGETVSVTYDYQATERGKRFRCNGEFQFQELYEGKYQQAHGSFTRPDDRNPDRRRVIYISWERVPDVSIQTLLGKSEIKSLKDLRHFVDAVRKDARYDDSAAEDRKVFPILD